MNSYLIGVKKRDGEKWEKEKRKKTINFHNLIGVKIEERHWDEWSFPLKLSIFFFLPK